MRDGLPPLVKNDHEFNVHGCKKFGLLFKRAFINQIRNPMDTMLKITQSVFIALIVLVVFGRVNAD